MSTETPITPKDREQLVREFFVDVIRSYENECDDVIYDELSEELLDKYDFKDIAELLNFDAVADVIVLGVKQKYGVDLHWRD